MRGNGTGRLHTILNGVRSTQWVKTVANRPLVLPHASPARPSSRPTLSYGKLASQLPQTQLNCPHAIRWGFNSRAFPFAQGSLRQRGRSGSSAYPWGRNAAQAQLSLPSPARCLQRTLKTRVDSPTHEEQHTINDSPRQQSERVGDTHSTVTQRAQTPSISQRLPNISHLHKPSRDDLLAAASGFWSRLKVRFKWFSIRSLRPFNADEIGAFFSWVLLGHVLWIILGTTTFFSLAIFALNTVFAQETLARWVGNYLTKSSGLKVVFESAIVPRWGDGVITFRNVFVSRRPGQGKGNVTKGSPSEEAAAAAFAANTVESHERNRSSESLESDNYTQFDLSLETVNVTLSFRKWFNSRGLLEDVEVKGVRGIIDRTSVKYGGNDIDPKSYKHEHTPGDFEIGTFKMEDLLVTVYQPGAFRPFPLSIYNCQLPQLRRQWLFYDFLSATVMSGSIDDSLFTIHPVQAQALTTVPPNPHISISSGDIPWKKQSRLRIVGLNVDHFNRGVEGPFSWIHQGNVDIVADIKLPEDVDESLMKIMTDFYERLEATVASPATPPSPKASHGPSDHGSRIGNDGKEDNRFLVLDLKLHLNDIRAAVPIFTRDLSYVNNALIRPIVAYMNSRRTFIPITCRVVKRISEFDGSWTIFDSGLMDDLSQETYEAFAQDVSNDQARLRRFRKVGLWSLQLAAQAFFMGLAGSLA